MPGPLRAFSAQARAEKSDSVFERHAICTQTVEQFTADRDLRADIGDGPARQTEKTIHPAAHAPITTIHGGTRQNVSATNATSAATKSRGARIAPVHTG